MSDNPASITDAVRVYIRAVQLIRQSKLEALQLEGELVDIVAESRQLLGTLRTPSALIGRMGTRTERRPP
jgi:hypothetical protein